MLRVKPGAKRPSDAIDQALFESVEVGLPWHVLIASAACSPEEAETRLYKLLHAGILEGTPGADARMTRATVEIVPHYRRDTPTERPPSAMHPSVNPAQYGTPSARPLSGAYPSTHPGQKSETRVSGKELPSITSGPRATRTSSTNHPAVQTSPHATNAMRPPPEYPPMNSGQYGVPSTRPTSATYQSVPATPQSTTTRPASATYRSVPANAQGVPVPRSKSATYSAAPNSAPSVPPFTPSSSYASVPVPSGQDLLRELRTLRGQNSLPSPEQVRRSSVPAARNSSPPDPNRFVVDSPLGSLISEFSQGSGMMRWSSARLREALEEELAGNYLQAVSILNVVLAQFEDSRIRTQRDRLQEIAQRASSGIFRSRALEAERKRNHREAAEHWRKVVEALPADAEAAVHAAICSLEAGNDKQAAVFAKKAVQLAPDNINAHRVLLRFFQKSGMEASAQREREILMKLRNAAK